MDIKQIRLANLREVIAKEVKISDFAERSGISPSMVSQYTGGNRGLGDTVCRRIEAAYGLGHGWMDHIHSGDAPATPNVTPAPIGHRLIPIINEVQAGTWREIREDFQTAEMLLTDLELSPYAFALTIRGESMLPEFREGDRVIIDPEVMPCPGDFVAAINGGNAATFKKYRERGTGSDGQAVFELVPLNPDYPTLRSDTEQISIIGTMMEHRKYRRKQ